MEKEVIKNIKEKMTKEEAKNAKGFHITIKDLDKNEVVFDKDIRGIIAAGVESDGKEGFGFNISKGPTIMLLAMLAQLEDLTGRIEKRIANGIGGEIGEKLVKVIKSNITEDQQ